MRVVILLVIFLAPFIENKISFSIYSKFTILEFVSAVVMLLGFVILIISATQLGSSLTMLARLPLGEKLVKAGLYKYTRNPIYLGGLLVVFGWSTITNSTVTLFASIVLGILFFYKMNLEEDFLESKFGDDEREQKIKNNCRCFSSFDED